MDSAFLPSCKHVEAVSPWCFKEELELINGLCFIDGGTVSNAASCHVMVDMVGCVMVRGVEHMSLQCNVT